ncbi:hypothetical protein FB451DRAFT_1185738 [Mycena latifolia]|nr:hypothetical protein FB451DRAFT_1185738 [Mycena latifolia]
MLFPGAVIRVPRIKSTACAQGYNPTFAPHPVPHPEDITVVGRHEANVERDRSSGSTAKPPPRRLRLRSLALLPPGQRWSHRGVGGSAGCICHVTGVVPITWGFSEYGRQHSALTNVIVTGIATLATAHLQYTVRQAAEEHVRMRLAKGLPFLVWGWLQGVAAGDIWPPLQSTWTWGWWLLLFGAMAGHSASIVAILQPQSFFDHVHYNDATPCGVDPALLTLNSNFTPQPAMDLGAFRMGLQPRGSKDKKK